MDAGDEEIAFKLPSTFLAFKIALEHFMRACRSGGATPMVWRSGRTHPEGDARADSAGSNPPTARLCRISHPGLGFFPYSRVRIIAMSVEQREIVSPVPSQSLSREV